MREFNILFSIRKGLGPEWVDKVIAVGLDDLPFDLDEDQIKRIAIEEAEKGLYRSDDYNQYGKNWFVKEVYYPD